jgi:hypothetical protein
VVVGYGGVLAVEQRHLRGLHDVASGVALSCLNQEVGFDVRENCKAEVCSGCGYVRDAGRDGRCLAAEKAALPEWDGKVVGGLLAWLLLLLLSALLLFRPVVRPVVRPVCWPPCLAAPGLAAERGVAEAGYAQWVQADKLRRASRCRCDALALWINRKASRRWNGRHVEWLVAASLDVEVKVNANAFGESIVKGDESHLNRDLEVLQPAELVKKVGDFLVHFLGLADTMRLRLVSNEP